MSNNNEAERTDLSQQKPIFFPVMSFVCAAAGSGWLALPKNYALFGIISATIMQLLSCLCALFSLKLLVKFIVKNRECKMYSDIVEKILGKKYKAFLNVLYFLNLVGT